MDFSADDPYAWLRREFEKGLPASAFCSYEFNSRMVADEDVLVPSPVKGPAAERRWCSGDRFAYKKELLWGMPLVPSSFRFDFWCYRTPEEARIGFKLHQLSFKVSSRRGIADYHPDAVLLDFPRLPVH